MTTPQPPAASPGLVERMYLRSVADRLYGAADDLPRPDLRQTRRDISYDLEEHLHSLTKLLAEIALQNVRHSRTTNPDTLARRRIGSLTRAATPLGLALADLGEVLTQVGFLQEIAGHPRTPDRAEAVRSAREVLDDRLDSARGYLTEASGQLHRDAERLTASAPARRMSPTPSATPAAAHPGPHLLSAPRGPAR
ncbi:hypothetical protein ACIO3O_08330 [Streptomyces sp. NPDC087440]|uniref:hypothetical protein n=1 Tax=Streptomyces sp. NPDC087440 TaxID=3365790 RepID=UPI0038012947